MTRFREAERGDVPAIVALLRDDALGAQRETAELDTYLAAFDAMAAGRSNRIVVAEQDGRIVGTYQITFIPGLSHRATLRAQVESVRVASDLRGRGIGHELMRDAERRARAEGARLLQLTTHASRSRAHAFYRRLGYAPTHLGFKLPLE